MKVVLGFFLIVSLALCSDVELVQVINFCRHGARTPNSFDYRPRQYAEDQGELTTLGLLQGYLLGQEMRERYVKRSNFLSSELKPNEVYIKSSYKSRTLKTAIAILNGLYPQESGVTHYNNYKITPREVLPLRSQYRELTEADLYNFTVNEEWALSNIDIGDAEEDYFFHAYKDDNCPIADKLIEDYMTSIEAAEVEAFFRNALYPRMEWQVNSVLGELKVNKEALNAKKAKKILDNWRCNTFHKLDHPQFSSMTVGLLKAVMQYQVYIVVFKEKLIRDIAVSNIFTSISSFTKGIINDKENTPKFVLFSGHDTNIEPILYSLLNEDEIFRREEYTLIPFASTISFYVYKNLEGSNAGNYFVEITFNDRPLHLPWCGAFTCPLEVFQAHLESTALPHVEEYCATTNPDKGDI
jgi:hypothetical protein